MGPDMSGQNEKHHFQTLERASKAATYLEDHVGPGSVGQKSSVVYWSHPGNQTK